MNFTVVLIARNELKNLYRLRAELHDYMNHGGQVIIMDTGSTDETVIAARELGFVVYEVGNSCRVSFKKKERDTFCETIKDSDIKRKYGTHLDPRQIKSKKLELISDSYFHFGNARTKAQNFAETDMILQIDASDRLVAFNWSYISGEIKKGARRFNYVQDYGGVHLYIERFYDKSQPNCSWKNAVHEYCDFNNKLPLTTLATTVLMVRHYRDNTKHRSYLNGLFGDWNTDKMNDRRIYYYARELYYSELWQSAIDIFKTHSTIISNKNVYMDQLSAAYSFMGECYTNIDKHEEAYLSFLKAIQFNPKWREPYIRLGKLAEKMKLFALEAGYGQAALLIPHTCTFAENIDNYKYRAHELCMIGISNVTTDKSLSKPYFEECYKHNPYGFAHNLAYYN